MAPDLTRSMVSQSTFPSGLLCGLKLVPWGLCVSVGSSLNGTFGPTFTDTAREPGLILSSSVEHSRPSTC